MAEVKRIYPGDTNGLIYWLEANYPNIESYSAIFKMSDGTTMTVYSVESAIEALGLSNMMDDTLKELTHNDGLITKNK